MEYYTYAYLREDGTPYYIGKGKGRRVYQRHNGFYPPSKDRILFLKKNLTEQEAFNHEKYMIFIFGRKDTGTGVLYNKTNGGDGVSGYILTEKDRKNKSWAKGKKFSELHKKRIGESNKGISRNTKERRKQLAEEIKNKPGMSRKGKPHSEETRKKISESTKGRIPWNKGLKLSKSNNS